MKITEIQNEINTTNSSVLWFIIFPRVAEEHAILKIILGDLIAFARILASSFRLLWTCLPTQSIAGWGYSSLSLSSDCFVALIFKEV